MQWINPFKQKYGISSNYGWRENPLKPGEQEFHHGADFLTPMRTPVYMMFDGWLDVYVDGVKTIYLVMVENGTNDRIDILHVDEVIRPQRQVKQGELVGYTGKSGEYVTGPHSHVDLRRNWEQNRDKYIDPAFIIDLPFNPKNMDEIKSVSANKDKDLGDVLRIAGISDPGSAGQKQNVANLNKAWLDKNGIIKDHNGTWQDMENKLRIGDIVKVRGNPSEPIPKNNLQATINAQQAQITEMERSITSLQQQLEDALKLQNQALNKLDQATIELQKATEKIQELELIIIEKDNEIEKLKEQNSGSSDLVELLKKIVNLIFNRK